MKKIYEISALVRVHTTVIAKSKKQAMDHVSDWENAWLDESNAEFIDVADVDLFDVRNANTNYVHVDLTRPRKIGGAS